MVSICNDNCCASSPGVVAFWVLLQLNVQFVPKKKTIVGIEELTKLVANF